MTYTVLRYLQKQPYLYRHPGVRENNANRFLLTIANLLIFIHDGGI